MNATTRLACIVLFGIGLLSAGCDIGAPPGDLGSLTEDADSDGFLELTPPAGIPLDDATNLHIRVASEVGREEIANIVASLGVEPGLLSLVDDRVVLTILLDYGDGVTQQIEEVRQIEPFDIAVEAACPQIATVNVLVQGSAPIIGSLDIFSDDFPFTRDVDFVCGERVELVAKVDDAGNIVVSGDLGS